MDNRTFREKLNDFKNKHLAKHKKVMIKKQAKKTPVSESLDFEIKITRDEIKRHKKEMNELERDLATYLRFKDLMGDKEFKSQREFAKYILSLDEDIMKDYERVYGDNIE